MKILHVETGRHLYGGPQQVIYLIKALRELGHDNMLICPPGSGIDSVARQARIPVRNLFCAGDLDLPFAYRLAQFPTSCIATVVAAPMFSAGLQRVSLTFPLWSHVVSTTRRFA
jgi:hypothetical protein